MATFVSKSVEQNFVIVPNEILSLRKNKPISLNASTIRTTLLLAQLMPNTSTMFPIQPILVAKNHSIEQEKGIEMVSLL